MPEPTEPPESTSGPRRRPSRRAVLVGAGVVVVAGVTAAVALRPRASGELVTPLLKTDRFTVAHHGGSLDWPEESLYAYQKSVQVGVDALEISLARSSDGVWFGLHDATLDRTSGTSGFVASEHTWAEIRTHRILPTGLRDPRQPSRPYARFDDVLDAYGDSHALFVDPKVVDQRYYDELFALVAKHVRNPRETLVAKGYCTSIPWAAAARARGHQTWGFYYASEIQAKPELLTSTEEHWTVMGLDYAGSAEQWSVVRALGKPVIGHVVPDPAAALTALRHGARGLMISGVAETVGHLPSSG
jgi:glycerophosphoryl diester phosphodiesterase